MGCPLHNAGPPLFESSLIEYLNLMYHLIRIIKYYGLICKHKIITYSQKFGFTHFLSIQIWKIKPALEFVIVEFLPYCTYSGTVE